MKGIKILIVIVIILVAILGLKMSGIISGKSYEKEIMTQEEIIALMKKPIESNNIYIKRINEDGVEGEIFLKDDILVFKMKSGYMWMNKDTEESLILAGNRVLKTGKMDVIEPLHGQKYMVIFLESLIRERIIELKYRETKIINEKETFLVDMNIDKSRKEQYVTELEKLNTNGWTYEAFFPNEDVDNEKIETKESERVELKIDKETGIIWYDMYIDFSVGTVTDEDVKKPDLTKYEVIDANEM